MGSAAHGPMLPGALPDGSPTCTVVQARALVLGCLCIFAMGGTIFGISSIYGAEYGY